MVLQIRARKRYSGVMSLLAVLAASPAGAASAFDHSTPSAIANLEFRAAAYELYQQRYFSSTTQLLQAISMPGATSGRSDNKAFLADYLYQPRDLAGFSQLLIAGRLSDAPLSKDETNDVLADLYVAMGLPKPAEQLLRSLKGKTTAAPKHSWLTLARFYYQRGYLTEAEQALANLDDLPQGAVKAQRDSLSALVLLADNRAEEAIAVLKDRIKQGQDDPLELDRYNLGLALLDKGNIPEGAAVIRQLSQSSKASAEAAPLRAQADINLAYALLGEKQWEQAAAVLQDAGHEDPSSNYALLGSGWVEFLKGDSRKALESWLPLTERNPSDEAVQEGLLTAPYAYYQVRDYAQASSYYQRAIDSYEKELVLLRAARGPLSDGSFLKALLTADTGNKEFDSQRNLETLPASPAASYLRPTLASHRFQEGLKNYRDLLAAREILTTAGSDIEASLSLLAKQRERYAAGHPRNQLISKNLDPVALLARAKNLKADLAQAEANHDVMAFASVKQKGLLIDLKEADTLLDKLKNNIVGLDVIQAKYQLLKGLMIWDLNEQYMVRLQEVKQQLRDLETSLNEFTHSQLLLTSSGDQINSALTKQETPFKSLQEKRSSLLAAAKSLLAEQQKYLDTQLVQGLEDGEKRLSRYLQQARLGVAQASDQLASASPQKDYSRTIAAYQAFLDHSGDTPYRRDTLFRTAYLKILQAENLDSAQSAAPAKGAKDRSDALYGEAIPLLVQLLKSYPNNPDNDRVLYNLAKAYDHRGETDTLLDTLERLTKEYPRSAHIDDVQFRRGELLFSLGLPAQAAEAYNAIVSQYPGSPLYEKALYKLAWSRYKEGRYDAAVDAFLPLLERDMARAPADHKTADPNLSRGEEEFINDILRGTSLCLAQLNGLQSLANYFAQHGERPYEYRLYETLAQLYLEQQRIEDAANVYRNFVARHPNYPQAPLIDSKILAVYEKGGFIDLVQTAKEDFIDHYEPSAAYWTKNPGADRGDTLNKVREYLQEVTRYAHAKAQKTKAAPDYQQAEHWYRLFFKSYPQDPLAPDMHFLFGEILFEDQRYADAAQEYEKVAYEYKDAHRGAEAAYAAVLAREKIAAGLAGTDPQAAAQQSFIALQRFSETYPNDPRAPAALVKIAQEWFSRHDLPKAELAAQGLLAMKPEADSALRRDAWMILGHSQFEEQHYADAEHSYQQTLALMPKTDDKRHDIEENLAAAVYKQGELARTAGDLRGAARHFLRIADITPSAGIAATAQYDAAAALLTLEDWPKAVQLLEGFRAHYPDNPLQSDVPPKLALAYQKTGDWRKAAVEMETIADQGKDEELKRDAVWQSAELYSRAGQAQNALRMYQNYLSRFPKPATQAIEAQQHLADLYAQQDDSEAQHHWLQQIIDTDKSSGAESNERSHLLAARASLTLADVRYRAFSAIKLTNPLKKSLKLKQQAMDDALAAYRAAGEYGIADITTASTYRAAQIYSELGKALMNSERPKGLSALELDQYNVLLEEQAYPFEEQAIALHEANAHRAAETIYDDWVKKSFADLSKLLPGRYAKAEKGEAYVDTIY